MGLILWSWDLMLCSNSASCYCCPVSFKVKQEPLALLLSGSPVEMQGFAVWEDGWEGNLLLRQPCCDSSPLDPLYKEDMKTHKATSQRPYFLLNWTWTPSSGTSQLPPAQPHDVMWTLGINKQKLLKATGHLSHIIAVASAHSLS